MSAAMTYTITEAAARLGPTFTVDWLKKHIADIPHIRSGEGTGRAGRIGFTEQHLAEIVSSREVRPKPAIAAADDGRITRRRSA